MMDGTGLEQLQEGLAHGRKTALHQQALLLEIHDEMVPERVTSQHPGIPQHHQSVSGTREGHIETPGIGEESNALVVVGTDAGEDDVVLLTALESIDGGHFDLGVEVLAEGAGELHVLLDEGPLAVVWGDDTDLGGQDTGAQEAGDDALALGGLKPVQVRGTAGAHLLRTGTHQEEHRGGGIGPWEIQGLPRSLTSSHAILQTAIVKGVGGEGTKARMHTILDLQADWATSQKDETLEEGLVEAGTGCLLVHDDGAELAVVTDEDELLGSMDHGNQGFGFDGLRGLVQQHGTELEALQSRITGTHTRAANHLSALQQ